MRSVAIDSIQTFVLSAVAPVVAMACLFVYSVRALTSRSSSTSLLTPVRAKGVTKRCPLELGPVQDRLRM